MSAPGPELRRRNRLLAAQHWPAGALEVCERLEAEHPGWWVTWMPASVIKGWERPAGWAASRDDVSLPGADQLRRLPEDGVSRQPWVHGATVDEVRKRITEMQVRVDRRLSYDDRIVDWMRAKPRY